MADTAPNSAEPAEAPRRAWQAPELTRLTTGDTAAGGQFGGLDAGIFLDS